jgi:hypothetical protein
MVCKILSPWSDERAGTQKSVAQIAVAHFSIRQSPPPPLVVAPPRPPLRAAAPAH